MAVKPHPRFPNHPKDPARVALGRRGGRPRHDPNETASVAIAFRVTPTLARDFRHAKRRAGVPMFGTTRLLVALIQAWIAEVNALRIEPCPACGADVMAIHVGKDQRPLLGPCGHRVEWHAMTVGRIKFGDPVP